jgi:hypothetical protein
MDIEEDDKLEQLDNTNNLLLKYDLEKENFHFEEEKLNILTEEKNNKRFKRR